MNEKYQITMQPKFPIKEDFNLSVINFFEPNKERIEKMATMLQKIEKSLDAYLDKSLEDNEARFACGDALESVTYALEELKKEMNYYQIEIVAKAKSWDKYPCDFFNGEDKNEPERRAYVNGYIDSKL